MFAKMKYRKYFPRKYELFIIKYCNINRKPTGVVFNQINLSALFMLVFFNGCSAVSVLAFTELLVKFWVFKNNFYF